MVFLGKLLGPFDLDSEIVLVAPIGFCYTSFLCPLFFLTTVFQSYLSRSISTTGSTLIGKDRDFPGHVELREVLGVLDFPQPGQAVALARRQAGRASESISQPSLRRPQRRLDQPCSGVQSGAPHGGGPRKARTPLSRSGRRALIVAPGRPLAAPPPRPGSDPGATPPYPAQPPGRSRPGRPPTPPRRRPPASRGPWPEVRRHPGGRVPAARGESPGRRERAPGPRTPPWPRKWDSITITTEPAGSDFTGSLTTGGSRQNVTRMGGTEAQAECPLAVVRG